MCFCCSLLYLVPGTKINHSTIHRFVRVEWVECGALAQDILDLDLLNAEFNVMVYIVSMHGFNSIDGFYSFCLLVEFDELKSPFFSVTLLTIPFHSGFPGALNMIEQRLL